MTLCGHSALLPQQVEWRWPETHEHRLLDYVRYLLVGTKVVYVVAVDTYTAVRAQGVVVGRRGTPLEEPALYYVQREQAPWGPTAVHAYEIIAVLEYVDWQAKMASGSGQDV